jgi:S1-C subfamily serine protease
MNKRVLKIIAWVLAFLVVLSVGAAAGGGVVYALTQSGKPFALIGAGPSDPEPGIVIASVTPDGPAAEAGVARGDILLQVDGEPVDDLAGLMRVLGEHEPGDVVHLTVLHGDDERTLKATLGDHDGEAYLGVVPCCGSFGLGREVFVRTTEPGALITGVEPDGPADQAGLEAGDVIVAVDEIELDGENDLADMIATYEPGDVVTLEVKSGGEESREVAVELGSTAGGRQHPEEEGVAYLGVRYQPLRSASRLTNSTLSRCRLRAGDCPCPRCFPAACRSKRQNKA